MIFVHGPSISMHPPENGSVTLTFESVTFKTSSVRGLSVCGSFGLRPFSGSRIIEFARFLWPSLCNLDLLFHDLEMVRGSGNE